MKKMMILGIPILAVGILFSDTVWGQDYKLPTGVIRGTQRTEAYHGTGRASFTALKVGQSARAAGMGNAFTAVANDINAIYWNTAGLTQVERFEYSLGYMNWLVDSRFLSGAIAWRMGQQTLGLAFIQFDAGTTVETTPMDTKGQFGRTIHAGDIFVRLAYARRMTDKLSLGVAAKFMQETLDQDKITSASFDFSSIFYTGFGSSRIAMTLRNYGKDQELIIPGSLPDDTRVAQPLMYTIALATEVMGRKGDPHWLTVAGELTHHIDDRERFHAGAELWLANTLALRAGYRWRYDLGDWSLGAGLHRDLGAGRKIGVDISYVNFGNVFDAPIRIALAGAF